MKRARRARIADGVPGTWVPMALERLLGQDSEWLGLWKSMTRQLGLPRPPDQVPRFHRFEFLRNLPDLLSMKRYLGYSWATVQTFRLLTDATFEQLGSALTSLRPGNLTPEVVRLCLTQAQLLACRDPERAADLAEVARVLVYELENADPVWDLSDEGMDFLIRTEGFTLKAEVESTSALIHACLGHVGESLRKFEVASSIVDTPSDIESAGRTMAGRPCELKGVARCALRAHGRSLAAASMLSASVGNLDLAVAQARDSAELYLQARDYSMAGLQHHQASRCLRWQGKVEQAAEELELALQLLDLRTSPRLHGRLLGELAFLYFEAGAAVRGNEEIELARRREQVQVSDFFAARGWLLAITWEVREGVRWLRRAREAVVPGALRSAQVLTLDLVEAELQLPFPREDPARWLEDEVSRAGISEWPALLQERWGELAARVRAGEVSVEKVRKLRVDLQRAEAFPRCEWAG